MSDNMDCPKVEGDCFLCDKPIIDAWNVGAWNDRGDILCMRCWDAEKEEWNWITGMGAT